MPRVYLTVEARNRMLRQIAERDARQRECAARERVNQLEESAELAARWAQAQRALTGCTPDLTEMPSDYDNRAYARDRLRALDLEEADLQTAIAVAIDCAEYGAGPALSHVEANFLFSLPNFEWISKKQKGWLKAILRKIDSWANSPPAAPLSPCPPHSQFRLRGRAYA